MRVKIVTQRFIIFGMLQIFRNIHTKICSRMHKTVSQVCLLNFREINEVKGKHVHKPISRNIFKLIARSDIQSYVTFLGEFCRKVPYKTR